MNCEKCKYYTNGNCTNASSDNLGLAMKNTDWCYDYEEQFYIQTDCKFIKDDYNKDVRNGCKALNDLYCRCEKCNFYKPKDKEVKSK